MTLVELLQQAASESETPNTSIEGKAANLIERQAAQINHLQMALADTEALEAETSARCLKQAAQIEMMREALQHLLCDVGQTNSMLGAIKARKALSTTPDQALEQFAAKANRFISRRG